MARIQVGAKYARSTRMRVVLPSALALVLTVAVCFPLHSWSWLALSGTVMTVFGALHMSRRLLRVGPTGLEDEAPPATINGNQFNWAHVGEGLQRGIDNVALEAGFWITIVRTIVGGALPVFLDTFAPF